MSEVIFIVEESPEGGYSARALGPSIFTEADDWQELRANVRDAVNCHFEEGEVPRVIRLHMLHEEIIGTRAAILRDVAGFHGMSRDELLNRLFT